MAEIAENGGEKLSIEAAMDEIERIAAQLEKGDAPLEKSLELYERATGLIKKCGAMLDEAEQKVMVLTRDETGAIAVAPFDKEDTE